MMGNFLEEATYALWGPGCSIFSFLSAAVAMGILAISYIPVDPDSLTQQMLRLSATYLVYALANLTGVWFLSLLIFSAGPLRILSNYKAKLSRNTNA
jgi:hypothetical protein